MRLYDDRTSHGEEPDAEGWDQSETRWFAYTSPLSIVDAIQLVQSRLGGIVTEAELEERAGEPVWEVEVATPDGAFRKVVVDSATGRMLPSG